MQNVHHPALHGLVEIDQEVPARDQIEVRERRIPDHIVVREQHERAELLADPVAAWLLDEEPGQPFGRDVGRVGQGVEAFARRGKRVGVDVGGKSCRVSGASGFPHVCSASSIAIEYASSPVAQPAIQTLI